MFSGIRARAASVTGAIPDRWTDRERHPQRASRIIRRKGKRASEVFLRSGRNRSPDEPVGNRLTIPRGGNRDSPLFPVTCHEINLYALFSSRTRRSLPNGKRSAGFAEFERPEVAQASCGWIVTRHVSEGRAQRGGRPSTPMGSRADFRFRPPVRATPPNDRWHSSESMTQYYRERRTGPLNPSHRPSPAAPVSVP